MALVIGVVGPCAAGKSTLAARLAPHGYPLRHIAQEHSFVPDMWQRITRPDVLIYLDVSYEEAQRRRPQACSAADYAEQVHRLRHAREHADLVLDTDYLTPDEVEVQVLAFLSENNTS
jgi:deoxyadenosine/deoxycytidine kinase